MYRVPIVVFSNIKNYFKKLFFTTFLFFRVEKFRKTSIHYYFFVYVIFNFSLAIIMLAAQAADAMKLILMNSENKL